MVSPHTAGVTHEARVNMGRIAAEQMLAALDGKPVTRVLNPEVWPRYAARFQETFGFAPEGQRGRMTRMKPSIETRTSWVVAALSLVILGVSFGAFWIAVVALKPIAAEMGGARSVPAFASALAWFGAGLGGIAMGWLADRYGVRWTVMFGAVMIGIGLAISSLGQASSGQTWQLYLGHGLFMGLLGNAGLNAPLYVYVSRWFDRRRGSALALIASGQYISGALWPPIFESAIAAYGWRATMLWFGAVPDRW